MMRGSPWACTLPASTPCHMPEPHAAACGKCYPRHHSSHTAAAHLHLIAANPHMHRQFFSEQYQLLDQQLFSKNRSVFPADVFNYNSFVWAVASVRSKLHAPLDSDPVALVPLADSVSELVARPCNTAHQA